MTTTTTLTGVADRPLTRSRPTAFNSMVAAAQVITSRTVRHRVDTNSRLLPWQQQAWDYYDTVGEFRFGVGWLSNGLSRVNLVGARPPEAVGSEPTPIDPDAEDTTDAERRAVELIEMIAGGAAGQGQLLSSFGQLLPVGGLAWMVACPGDGADADVYVEWKAYSQDAIDVQDAAGGTQRFRVRTGEAGDGWRDLPENSLVVKCWRPHPRRPWEPDAPVRAVLPVLAQIDLLGAHITATGRSRLAGAGVFAVPTEATFPDPPPNDDGTPSDVSPFDYFVEQLIEAMTTPIRDRDNASAVVPLIVQIPGEYVDKLQHISFSTEFDERVTELMQEAIKRLALGLDMPPEVLTGMAGVNHWTAWQVEDTAVTLHIEPNAEIICNALTVGYLRAALEAEGFDPDAAIVWYDTGDLTTPPDRSGNVVEAYDRKEASGEALRRYTGLEPDDAPKPDEVRARVLLELLKADPSLAPQLLAALGMLDGLVLAPAGPADPAPGDSAADPDAPAAPAEPTEQPPDMGDRPGQAEAGLLASCDGIVFRAMERAGGRLRVQMGRKLPGGPQVVDAGDPATLHTRYDATEYAALDQLLDGAFTRVPEIAAWYDVDAEALTRSLTAYCKMLLSTGNQHDRDRLATFV